MGCRITSTEIKSLYNKKLCICIMQVVQKTLNSNIALLYRKTLKLKPLISISFQNVTSTEFLMSDRKAKAHCDHSSMKIS